MTFSFDFRVPSVTFIGNIQYGVVRLKRLGKKQTLKDEAMLSLARAGPFAPIKHTYAILWAHKGRVVSQEGL